MSAQHDRVQRLLQKQREYEAFLTVLSQSEALAQLFGSFATSYESLVDGVGDIKQVVEHWRNVFRVTGLALESVQTQRETDKQGEPYLPEGAKVARFVRIPVKDEHEESAAEVQQSVVTV